MDGSPPKSQAEVLRADIMKRIAFGDKAQSNHAKLELNFLDDMELRLPNIAKSGGKAAVAMVEQNCYRGVNSSGMENDRIIDQLASMQRVFRAVIAGIEFGS